MTSTSKKRKGEPLESLERHAKKHQTLFDYFSGWIAEKIRLINFLYCSSESKEGKLSSKRQPLTVESMIFIYKCAISMMKEYLLTHPLQQQEEKRLKQFQSLAMAALLNAMIFSGAEEHCDVQLFPKIFKYCPECDAKMVTNYQVELAFHTTGCASQLHSNLTK